MENNIWGEVFGSVRSLSHLGGRSEGFRVVSPWWKHISLFGTKSESSVDWFVDWVSNKVGNVS
jgi:hypothetical protein